MTKTSLAGVLLGGAGAVAVDALVHRTAPRQRHGIFAAGLVAAAAVYPVARLGRPRDASESVTMLAAAATSTAALVLPERPGRVVLAAGWLAHAAFDAAFHHADESRIPGWYPPMCAGVDLAIAARLAWPAHVIER